MNTEEFIRELERAIESEIAPGISHDPGETGVGTLPSPRDFADRARAIHEAVQVVLSGDISSLPTPTDSLVAALQQKMAHLVDSARQAKVDLRGLQAQADEVIIRVLESAAKDYHLSFSVKEGVARISTAVGGPKTGVCLDFERPSRSAADDPTGRLTSEAIRRVDAGDAEGAPFLDLVVSSSADATASGLVEFMLFAQALGATLLASEVRVRSVSEGSIIGRIRLFFTGSSADEARRLVKDGVPLAAEAIRGAAQEKAAGVERDLAQARKDINASIEAGQRTKWAEEDREMYLAERRLDVKLKELEYIEKAGKLLEKYGRENEVMIGLDGAGGLWISDGECRWEIEGVPSQGDVGSAVRKEDDSSFPTAEG